MLLFWRFDLFWMATVQREREGRGEREERGLNRGHCGEDSSR